MSSNPSWNQSSESDSSMHVDESQLEQNDDVSELFDEEEDEDKQDAVYDVELFPEGNFDMEVPRFEPPQEDEMSVDEMPQDEVTQEVSIQTTQFVEEPTQDQQVPSVIHETRSVKRIKLSKD